MAVVARATFIHHHALGQHHGMGVVQPDHLDRLDIDGVLHQRRLALALVVQVGQHGVHHAAFVVVAPGGKSQQDQGLALEAVGQRNRGGGLRGRSAGRRGRGVMPRAGGQTETKRQGRRQHQPGNTSGIRRDGAKGAESHVDGGRKGRGCTARNGKEGMKQGDIATRRRARTALSASRSAPSRRAGCLQGKQGKRNQPGHQAGAIGVAPEAMAAASAGRLPSPKPW